MGKLNTSIQKSNFTISLIIPVLNEMNFLEGLISQINDWSNDIKEIIFVDGGSTDGSHDFFSKLTLRDGRIKLLKNTNRYVSYALNLAIADCTGDIIVRLDAHSDYAPNYLQKIIETFKEEDADIVGGPTRTKYLGSTQEAIAYVISHKIGIGGSKVHDENYRGYIDSVTFGAWKISIFEKIGLFDTRLIRNQDDEFHYRARSYGLKIFQNPEIKLWYYPRSTFSGFFKQYFQYGLYKPLVLRKVKSGLSIRHLVPAVWVVYLVTLFPIWVVFKLYAFIPLIIYLLVTLYISFSVSKPIRVKVKILFSFWIIHFSYGLGFISGIPKAIGTRDN